MVYREGIVRMRQHCSLKIANGCVVVQIIVVLKPAFGPDVILCSDIRRRMIGSYLLNLR